MYALGLILHALLVLPCALGFTDPRLIQSLPAIKDKIADATRIMVSLVTFATNGDAEGIRRTCVRDSLTDAICHDKTVNWFVVAKEIDLAKMKASSMTSVETRQRTGLRRGIRDWMARIRTFFRRSKSSTKSESTQVPAFSHMNQRVRNNWQNMKRSYDVIVKRMGLKEQVEPKGRLQKRGLANILIVIFTAVYAITVILPAFVVSVIAFMLMMVSLLFGDLLIFILQLLTIPLGLIEAFVAHISKQIWGQYLPFGVVDISMRFVCLIVSCISTLIAGAFAAWALVGFVFLSGLGVTDPRIVLNEMMHRYDDQRAIFHGRWDIVGMQDLPGDSEV